MTDAFQIGSHASDEDNKIKTFEVNALVDDYDTFQNPEGTDYQITAGRHLWITKIMLSPGSAACSARFGYGDDVVTASAVPPTNEVQLSNDIWLEVAKHTYEFNVMFRIPAGKYPYIFVLVGQVYFTGFGVEIED